MFKKCALFVCCMLAVMLTGEGVTAKLPSYIKVCKKNDPQLEDCILRSVESLRPKLIEGMPEINVPALEPLLIPEIVVALRNQGFRAVGHNVLVHGASRFKINKLKVDIKSNTFSVSLTLQQLSFDADYDVNLRVGVLPIVSKGPLKANATGISCEAILHGKREMVNGIEVMTFPTVDIQVDIKNFHVKIERLFPDRALNDATNDIINQNSKDIIKSIQPIIERTVGNVIIDIANKVTKNIPYSEIFPED